MVDSVVEEVREAARVQRLERLRRLRSDWLRVYACDPRHPDHAQAQRVLVERCERVEPVSPRVLEPLVDALESRVTCGDCSWRDVAKNLRWLMTSHFTAVLEAYDLPSLSADELWHEIHAVLRGECSGGDPVPTPTTPEGWARLRRAADDVKRFWDSWEEMGL